MGVTPSLDYLELIFQNLRGRMFKDGYINVNNSLRLMSLLKIEK